MLQPEERGRAERFKREKVEKRQCLGDRDERLCDYTEEPEVQRELERKNIQET